MVNIADGTSKSHRKDLSTKDCEEKESIIDYNYTNKNSSLLQQESIAACLVPKQCRKLHWGYDMRA